MCQLSTSFLGAGFGSQLHELLPRLLGTAISFRRLGAGKPGVRGKGEHDGITRLLKSYKSFLNYLYGCTHGIIVYSYRSNVSMLRLYPTPIMLPSLQLYRDDAVDGFLEPSPPHQHFPSPSRSTCSTTSIPLLDRNVLARSLRSSRSCPLVAMICITPWTPRFPFSEDLSAIQNLGTE